MSSSDLPPSQLIQTIVHSISKATTPADLLTAWDASQSSIATLYKLNTSAGRQDLAGLEYEQTWKGLIDCTFNIVPVLLDAWRARPTTVSDESLAADDNDEDSSSTLLDHITQSRLASCSRIVILAKNLCPGNEKFQGELRAHVLGREDVNTSKELVRTLKDMDRDDVVIDVKPLLKNLFQMYANMLVPSGTHGDTKMAWKWVEKSMWPEVSQPLLTLSSEAHPDLVSTTACIVHHALLNQHATIPCDSDIPQVVREAAVQVVNGEHDVLFQLLRASLPGVLAQIAQVNKENDEEDEREERSFASKKEHPPVTLFDWHPQGAEPCWMLHLLDICLRSDPGVVSKILPKASATEWLLFLRLTELWAESLDTKHARDADALLKQRQSQLVEAVDAGGERKNDADSSLTDDSTLPITQLTHTAEAVASNLVHLVQWLQAREHIPLPVVVLPGKNGDSASGASSNPQPVQTVNTPTTSIPLDAACNSILNTLGHVLLFKSWDHTVVFSAMRAGLLRENLAQGLIHLLLAADSLDGGAMFSDLYKPLAAGHTRHTKQSEDPEAYVNQFGEKGMGATSSSSSSSASAVKASTPAAPVAPPARRTPYQFKSNVLRLIASLSFHSRSFQDSFGSDAIYACMNHSVLDEHNPLMREYAILALRNLMEDHPGNQQIVQDLRMEGIANQQELREMGVQTTLDPQTGSIKIANQNTTMKQEEVDWM